MLGRLGGGFWAEFAGVGQVRARDGEGHACELGSALEGRSEALGERTKPSERYMLASSETSTFRTVQINRWQHSQRLARNGARLESRNDTLAGW